MKRILDHELVAVTQESQIAEFLVESATISQQSWQAKRIGVRVRADEKQLKQLTQLAQLGALRCYLLHSKGRPVAFSIGTQWNGRYLLEETGYNTSYAKFSPGTVLLLRMLEDMFEHDTPQWLDFGGGDGDYKRLFGNHSTQSGTLLMISRRVWPRMVILVNRVGARLEQWLRACVRHVGLTRRLRRLYRR